MDKYGLKWPENYTPLNIEMEMIKAKGKMEIQGKTYGLGLAHHYQAMFDLLWPEDDHHRWADLCLKRKCENEILVMMGSSDSNKTYFSSKYVLAHWWVMPHNTLWMVSSTELRGAELRNWGTIKSLFNRAREIYPWLPGVVLESKTCITPDTISEGGREGRLLTKGIIFIPTKKGGRWVGLGAYAGIKHFKGGRLGHFGDECFPAGTMVETPNGKRTIETIIAGDFVYSLAGKDRVLATSERQTEELITIALSDKRTLQCTPHHPIFTQKGWVKACELSREHYMLSSYEANSIVHGVRTGIPTAVRDGTEKVLQQILLREAQPQKSGVSQEILLKRAEPKTLSVQNSVVEAASGTGGEHFQGNASHEPNEKAGGCKKGVCRPQGHWTQTESEGWKWNWPDKGGMAAHENVSGGDLESRNTNREMERERVSSGLQSRFSVPSDQASDRSGRRQPRFSEAESQGREKGLVPEGAWVDSVTIQKQGDIGFPYSDSNPGRCRVYNLKVERHPSYVVNGFLVHNCSFMGPGFLDAYANWYGKTFEGILDGNPTDLDDPLCKASKPIGGWESWSDTGKTQEWRSTFYNAWVIALDGRDSPNMDRPKDLPPLYPYLISHKKHEAVAALHGKEHPLYMQQCVGKPVPGLEKFRVIPHSLPEKANATGSVIWDGADALTDVLSLDAAYGGEGGDRCVLTHLRFGKEVGAGDVIEMAKQVDVPISVNWKAELAEVQIAKFCKQYAESQHIQPGNFYFDARATLAVTLAREWSSEVNAVDFGGAATDRPASQDEFINDPKTGDRRLKRCNEHYSKFVTELWFTIYYLMIGKQIRGLTPEVIAELRRRIWKKVTGDRICVETKKEMKERLSESPDLADSLVTGVEGCRRLGFIIAVMKEKDVQAGADDDWLEKALTNHREGLKRHELRRT